VARKQRRQTAAPVSAAAALLDWYDRQRRDLPWRMAPGVTADPYRVWLSEIMLQQTTVKAVIPYYERFLARWPTVTALAAAELEEVLTLWAGLGYYSRARNLHACAQAVVTEYGGQFPSDEALLRKLPGIGPYPAAAIAAIAFGQKATPVDGNIERVVARLFQVMTPLPTAKPELRRLAATLTPDNRAGDHAQAMMDLGATVCTPKRPSCLVCPVQTLCKAREAGVEAALPAREGRAERPVRYGIAFVAMREDAMVLLRQRPDEGLLARMIEVPSTPWVDEPMPVNEALRTAPVRADWWPAPTPVIHTFTHFRLELTVYRAVVSSDATLTFWADAKRCRWVHRRDLNQQPLPSLMRKVLGHGLKET